MAIQDLCHDTITLEHHAVEQGQHGENLFEEPITLFCRIEDKMIEIWGPQGQSKVPGTVIIFPTAISIDPEDRITLPNGNKPTIVSIKIHKGSASAHHTSVTCKGSQF